MRQQPFLTLLPMLVCVYLSEPLSAGESAEEPAVGAAVPAVGFAPTPVNPPPANPAPSPAGAAPTTRRLMPYFEHGAPTPADRAMILECLRLASDWTDAAIVVVAPGHESIFRDLRRGLGERPFHIVPGIKVANALEQRRFDDVGGWTRVGRYVAEFATAAQSSEVFLECEWALEPYWANRVELNPADMTACINQLPPDLTYTFYPGGHGGLNQASIRDNLGKAAVLWAAILDSRRRVRLTASTPTNHDETAGWTLRGDYLLRRMSVIPPLESIYVGKDLNDREIGGFAVESFRTVAAAKMRSAEAYIWAVDMLAVCRGGR